MELILGTSRSAKAAAPMPAINCGDHYREFHRDARRMGPVICAELVAELALARRHAVCFVIVPRSANISTTVK